MIRDELNFQMKPFFKVLLVSNSPVNSLKTASSSSFHTPAYDGILSFFLFRYRDFKVTINLWRIFFGGLNLFSELRGNARILLLFNHFSICSLKVGVKECRKINNKRIFILLYREQILIAGYQIICIGVNCESQKEIIIGIAGELHF